MRGLYLSEIVFLFDIMNIPRIVDHSKPKKQKQEEIMELLNKINKQLPSFVYIPSESCFSWLDHSLRRMIIARIEPQETRLFQTKTKTNFTCCFQLISPEEYLMRNFYSYKSKREKFIEQQLEKIQALDSKQDYTPALLLVQSNMASQSKGLMAPPKPVLVTRNTDAPPKYNREAPEVKSSPILIRTLRERQSGSN